MAHGAHLPQKSGSEAVRRVHYAGIKGLPFDFQGVGRVGVVAEDNFFISTQPGSTLKNSNFITCLYSIEVKYIIC